MSRTVRNAVSNIRTRIKRCPVSAYVDIPNAHHKRMTSYFVLQRPTLLWIQPFEQPPALIFTERYPTKLQLLRLRNIFFLKYLPRPQNMSYRCAVPCVSTPCLGNQYDAVFFLAVLTLSSIPRFLRSLFSYLFIPAFHFFRSK